MSEPISRDFAGPLPELPHQWRLLLVDSRMKVLAFAGSAGASGKSPERGLDLADYLSEQDLDLAEVGELLVCLEDMPTDCELRLRLGNPVSSIVARGFDQARGVSCVVLRPSADEASEKALPAAWAWASATLKRLGLLDSHRPKSPMQILIVDRNPEVVTYGRILSRKLGCRSSGALSGGEALAQAKSRPYDLIILDGQMGGMGAVALGALVKERSARDWGREPVVVHSISETAHDEDRSQLVLEKPIGLNGLKEVVEMARLSREGSKLEAMAQMQLPVLRLDIWADDQPLLRRLARALVAQSGEFAFRIGQERAYSQSLDFARDLNSLKNGCDILHAIRLGAACKDLLGVCQHPDSREMQQRLDSVLMEIEGFRLFAASQGFLRDEW